MAIKTTGLHNKSFKQNNKNRGRKAQKALSFAKSLATLTIRRAPLWLVVVLSYSLSNISNQQSATS